MHGTGFDSWTGSENGEVGLSRDLANIASILAGFFLLASCSPVGGSSESTESVAADRIVVVLGQEPPDLAADRPSNGLLTAYWIREAMLESFFSVDKNLEYTTELLASEPDLRTDEDGSVAIDYELRSGLRWSDREPLTAADVLYTFDLMVEGCATDNDGSVVENAGADSGCVLELASRDGLDIVTDVTVKDDLRFTIEMASFYAGWREMFGPVYAEHAYGEDADAVNQNLLEMSNGEGVLPTSGPMVFGRWSRGESILLRRNDRYHGSTSPDARNRGVAHVEEVEVAFIPDIDSQITAVLANEVDVIMNAPDESFERLRESDSFVLSAQPGLVFEHWSFNVLNRHLAKPDVREAIAFGIDKKEIVSVLYEPLFGDRISEDGLGNTLWMSNHPGYENNQTAYIEADAAAAKQALLKVGYEIGADGIYTHPADGRLALRVTTPPGNRLRALQLELMKAQLAKIGIEIIIEPGKQNFFQETIASEQAMLAASTGGAEGDPTVWDIAQFAWSSFSWPGSAASTYVTGSPRNIYGYANSEYDEHIAGCAALAEEGEQIECYNKADRFVSTLEESQDGLIVLPITQRPSFFGYNSDTVTDAPIAGDTGWGGPLANIFDYRLRE